MVVIFNANVEETLSEYCNSLKNYPISRERAHQKFEKLMSSLNSLGTSVSTPPLCMNKDWQQSSSWHKMKKIASFLLPHLSKGTLAAFKAS